eukprot:scaffold157552_cov18-Tisochrysis_lutea.AAC.1
MARAGALGTGIEMTLTGPIPAPASMFSVCIHFWKSTLILHTQFCSCPIRPRHRCIDFKSVEFANVLTKTHHCNAL